MNEGICSPFDNTTPVMERSVHASLDPCPHAHLPLVQVTSHSPAESTTGPTAATSVTNGRDSKPWQLRQTAGNMRCSDERLQTENSVLREPEIRTPRVAKSEWFPRPAERQRAFPVVGKDERSMLPHLPTSSVALTPHALSHIGPSQARHASSEFGGSFTKPPYEGGCEWQLIKAASPLIAPDVRTRSPEAKTGMLQLVSKPSNIWAYASCSLDSELEWQAWGKPPKVIAPNRRCRTLAWNQDGPRVHLQAQLCSSRFVSPPDQIVRS